MTTADNKIEDTLVLVDSPPADPPPPPPPKKSPYWARERNQHVPYWAYPDPDNEVLFSLGRMPEDLPEIPPPPHRFLPIQTHGGSH